MAGSGYHEQGRNGLEGKLAWLGELLLVLALIAVGMLTVIMLGALAAEQLHLASKQDDQIFADPTADMALQLAALAVGIPTVLWAARHIGKRPAGTVSSVAGRIRWKWLGRCAATAFPLMALQIGLLLALTWATEPSTSESPGAGFPGWPSFLLSMAVLGAVVPFQAAAEEYVFRGWLVQWVGRAVRTPWPGIALASLLFALIHGLGEPTGFALLVYSSLWWGWLVIRTGGLEAVIALHVANNVIALTLATAFGELSSDATAADAPWQSLVLELVFAPMYCLTMARLAKNRSLPHKSPAATG